MRPEQPTASAMVILLMRMVDGVMFRTGSILVDQWDWLENELHNIV